MDMDTRPRRRRRRPGGAGCDGAGRGFGRGPGRREGGGRGSRDSLGERTATRALVAAGAHVAQDLRDAEGLTRPLLRRAALRLVRNPSEPVRRIGRAYLRIDPPAPEEQPQRGGVIQASRSASSQRALPAPPSPDIESRSR